MNFNILPFFDDINDVLAFRYQKIDHYRYGLPVFLVMMVMIGVSNALTLKTVFGYSLGIFAFGFVFGILKWLLLTRATTGVFQRLGSPRIPFLGYTLLTEAMIQIPILLLPVFPESLSFVPLLYLWGFGAQLMGFAKISGQPVRNVCIAYVVYFVLVWFFNTMIMGLFVMAGWLDLQDMNQHITEFLLQNQVR